jgi:hypothetical protein
MTGGDSMIAVVAVVAVTAVGLVAVVVVVWVEFKAIEHRLKVLERQPRRTGPPIFPPR